VNNKSIVRSGLLALGAAGLALLAGCGSNPAAPIQAPTVPPVAPPSPSVTINPLPPLSIEPGGMVTIGAIVSNGSGSAGVNWTCLPLNLCGSFSPASTDSGSSTTYTAPSSDPAGGYVTIVATYVYQPSARATASTVISGAASIVVLKGQYALFLTSPTGKRGVTSVGGSITLDGTGNVEGGVVDIVSPTVLDLKDPILQTSSNGSPLTSGYSVDAAGRGRMRLITANGQILDFSLALTSPSHALVAEIDGNPGSGTLDLQQHPSAGFVASQITSAYSFTMTGTARTDPTIRVSVGGVFNAEGAGMLSGGQLDTNTGGMMSSSPLEGTFSAPDSNGRGTMQLSIGRSFIYYLISSKALRMLEADSVSLMGGSAYWQGTGIIFIANECVYEHSGWSTDGLTITAGEFYISEGDADITRGISDSNVGSSPAIPKTGVPVTGSAGGSDSQIGTLNIADAAGSSSFKLYAVDPSIDILDPNDLGFDSDHYGAGNALLLHTDGNINGTGVLFEVNQSLPAFRANHAIQLTNPIATSTPPDELDLAGVMIGDGSANFVNGLADYDRNESSNPSAVLDASVTGTFFQDVANPRHLSGSLTISTPITAGAYPFISASVNTFSVSYYRISVAEAIVMQTDSSASSWGHLSGQIFP
jgi:hypothetical protein